jgi:predicted NUDIX family NTP pyrophosphohydrolase
MRQSAGILAYRFKEDLQVFLVHPGGPFFKNKDLGAWTIPKGELAEDEEPLDAAIREFSEETGQELSGDFVQLSPVKQKGGKIVLAWAIEKDINENNIKSNTFQMEWPPRSGKMVSFPEVDKAAWFSVDEAKEKINAAQVAFIDEIYKLNH